MTRLAVLLTFAAALAACATPTEPRETELDRLAAECAAKGGILTPRGAPPVSGNERANHFCEIRGASRISR